MASQARWLAAPENQGYFRGPVNVARVQAWRSCHPGYWRRARRVGMPLQDLSMAQPVDSLSGTATAAGSPLHSQLPSFSLIAALVPIRASFLRDRGVSWTMRHAHGNRGTARCGRLKDIRAFIDGLYAIDLHAKRFNSLAAATLGVMTGASLAVAMIGQALAQARGLVTSTRSSRSIACSATWHRCLGELLPLGATSGGIVHRYRRRHGLDRLRRRRSGHAGAQPGDRPWPGDAAVVAVGVERR